MNNTCKTVYIDNKPCTCNSLETVEGLFIDGGHTFPTTFKNGYIHSVKYDDALVYYQRQDLEWVIVQNIPINTTIPVTYNDLVTLINTNGLIPNQKYLLTDYQTVHYIVTGFNLVSEDIITGPVEGIILTASTSNTLDVIAYSSVYKHDILYYDWNPLNWINDISFGNGINMIDNWKGVIYKRVHTLNNISAPGDWRHCKTRRWKIPSAPSGFFNKYIATRPTDIGVTDVNDFQDFTLFNFNTLTDTLEQTVTDVTIGHFRESTGFEYYVGTILSNNVFHIPENTGWWVVIKINIRSNSYYNTFTGYMDSLTFGTVHKCRFPAGMYNITIGELFSSTFKENSQAITSLGVSQLDFTNSTHATATYTKTIHRKPNGTHALTYIDNSNLIVTVNATD